MLCKAFGRSFACSAHGAAVRSALSTRTIAITLAAAGAATVARRADANSACSSSRVRTPATPHTQAGTALLFRCTRLNLAPLHSGGAADFSEFTQQQPLHQRSKGASHGKDEAHTGGEGTTSSASSASSAYEQFHSQQRSFHRHSFHEKGSVHRRQPHGEEKKSHRGQGTSASDNHEESREGGAWQRDASQGQKDSGDAYGYSGPDSGTSRAEQFGGRHTSATAQERREMSRRWEKAFFGRVHYESGMHDRFQAALDAEEHERLAGCTNSELVPDWPADEEAPPHLFCKLSPAQQLRYVLNRLEMGERRIRYAADYGSLSMMYQLNLGEMMVSEAERLLGQCGWMNEELAEKIEEVNAVAAKTKYDYDLD